MEGREENKQVVKGRQEDREDGFEAGWNTNPLETRSPTCVIPVAMEAQRCKFTNVDASADTEQGGRQRSRLAYVRALLPWEPLLYRQAGT